MFEHSLIGLEARKKSRRGWLSLPVAVLIHLAAFATFTFASYWEVGEVPEPSMNVVFYELVSPPPPPPPQRGSNQPATQTTVKPPETKPVMPQQPVQPRDVPNELPPVASQMTGDVVVDLPPGDPNGVDEGGVPDGVRDGVPFSNGTDSSVISTGIVGPAPAPANDKPIVVGGAVKKPVAIYQPQPRYTETARKIRIQGLVVLDAVIDEQGNVIDLKVRKGLPMGLDQAALDAVSTWRFKPATLHGQPVKVYFTLTVNFQLQ